MLSVGQLHVTRGRDEVFIMCGLYKCCDRTAGRVAAQKVGRLFRPRGRRRRVRDRECGYLCRDRQAEDDQQGEIAQPLNDPGPKVAGAAYALRFLRARNEP